MNNKYIIEFIGTFFLVFTVAMTGNPLAIGAILMAMVYMGGYISGGHYNPAVTLAAYLQKKVTVHDALRYLLFQFGGSIAAVLAYGFIRKQAFIVTIATGVSFWDAFFLEVLFTFALVSVVLHTAVSPKNTPNQFFGIAIGFTVLVGAYAAGPVSGGAFNPVVGIGPYLVNFMSIQSHLPEIALYIFGPVLGALLASLLYSKYFHITSKK